MKKRFVISLLMILILAACNNNESYTYWTESTDNQIQRLDEAKIKYEIREGAIFVKEKDLEKVVACCF